MGTLNFCIFFTWEKEFAGERRIPPRGIPSFFRPRSKINITRGRGNCKEENGKGGANAPLQLTASAYLDYYISRA
jgi:hypothetical protein